jgi:hypothetical protein
MHFKPCLDRDQRGSRPHGGIKTSSFASGGSEQPILAAGLSGKHLIQPRAKESAEFL